ncbi:unnamed protein product [Caenorhabditis angaria]|uniref:Receptor L-domain domain-containing protein n=1 Tax=Caenorhabditis angaria TaxID=860376 RepID=A0A9P1ITG6_9PELO|nr:unnamed protein product [Caenorhabditis angaria]
MRLFLLIIFPTIIFAYFDPSAYSQSLNNVLRKSEKKADIENFCSNLGFFKNQSGRVCSWYHKKTFGRKWEKCDILIGDIILENEKDIVIFQKSKIMGIYGSLIIRNIHISIIDLDHLKIVGCEGKEEATILIENIDHLEHLLIYNLKSLIKSTENQKVFIVRNCTNLSLQYVLRKKIQNAAGNNSDLVVFNTNQTVIRVKSVLHEDLTPAFIASLLLFFAFIWHFYGVEIRVLRLKEREDVIIQNLIKMRNTVLASELLVQTPSTVKLKFDQPVLKTSSRNKHLVQLIEKRLKDM